ncbi:MAG TPA: rhodanese-like domain-containing protein [Alphaproteobacteria bacterium]|nr:rhodanese-like domain-containing protein [Alphaproteobacteria bacterium]
MQIKPLYAVLLLVLSSLATYAGAESSGNIFQATLMESNQKTPEISTEELRKVLAEKSAVVFDARPAMEYAVSHIPGALNVSAKPGLPMSEYVSDVAEIGRRVGNNKTTPIVIYCNGPFCGKSKRLAEELVAAGYTNVRRYQLGIPVWRALVGVTEIELAGMLHVLQGDKTAVFLDSRSPEEFQAGSIPGAKNLPLAEVKKAKDDGRLPMEDHNTRVIVFGGDGGQARAVAEAIAKEAFHNVSYFAGSFEELRPKVAGK